MRIRSWQALFLALAATGCRPHTSQAPHGLSVGSSPAFPSSLPPRLVDVTAPSGVHFQHTTGAFGRKWFPETNGSGAAIFDYDGDGRPDLFLVNDRGWSDAERAAAHLPPGPARHPT